MDIKEAESLLDGLAKQLHKINGSDLILTSETSPGLKVNGEIHYIKTITLKEEDIEAMAKSKLSEKLYAKFINDLELNFMIDYPGIAQFRTNIYKQKDTIGMVLRLIPVVIPSIESLSLPNYLKEIASLKRGLVLFTGGTGVGKSTSLASLIDYRNRNFSDHIVTIEDPIEFVHKSQKSIISQREIGIDTHSYAKAMKSALRQAPDVLLVGEIRDMEVMEQAMAFAETGHLVFATLHATSAKLTLERIINLFPHERREKLLQDLAESLQAVVCQRLMHKAGGGRIAALEIMTTTPHIKMLISEGKLSGIGESMDRASMREGVISFDNYILGLLEKGDITLDEAYKYVHSVNDFKQRIREKSENKELISSLTGSNNDGYFDWTLEEPVNPVPEIEEEDEITEIINQSYVKGS